MKPLFSLLLAVVGLCESPRVARAFYTSVAGVTLKGGSGSSHIVRKAGRWPSYLRTSCTYLVDDMQQTR